MTNSEIIEQLEKIQVDMMGSLRFTKDKMNALSHCIQILKQSEKTKEDKHDL